MTNMNATNKQLELGFNGLPPRAAAGREGRIARANWWFARMRDIVEQAMEVPGEPPPLFRMPIADMYAGIHGVAAACAALVGRAVSTS